MQTILSEKQIELLQLNHIDFQQFVETSKKQYPFVKRSLKHYKMHPKIAWDADKSILTLDWLNLQQSQHHELANQITHALNFEYYMKDDDSWMAIETQAIEDTKKFYQNLAELKDFRCLACFFCHTDSILKIYKRDAKKYIELTFHSFELKTPDFKLKGNQGFVLDWLIERIQIIIQNGYNPENVKKFFLVWAEVHRMFWW